MTKNFKAQIEAAHVTFKTLPDRSGCPGWGKTMTARAEKNRYAFTLYAVEDVFQAAHRRAQAAGVELPAEQMAIMEAAVLRIAGRDAEWWSRHGSNWGKLLMDEVRSA